VLVWEKEEVQRERTKRDENRESRKIEDTLGDIDIG
jgi:hypothetical protein